MPGRSAMNWGVRPAVVDRAALDPAGRAVKAETTVSVCAVGRQLSSVSLTLTVKPIVSPVLGAAGVDVTVSTVGSADPQALAVTVASAEAVRPVESVTVARMV